MELPALEREVLRLLSELPTSGSNAEQLALFQRVQELVFHRDPTGDAHALLHAAAPFVTTLAQHQNAALVAALLQFLAQASRRSAVFLRELYEVANTLLMLSFSTEKNVMSAIQLALASLPQAFQFVNNDTNNNGSLDTKRAIWAAVTSSLEQMVEIVATTPLLPIGSADSNNNRSALVWLRAWKYLESAVMLLSTAKDAVVYRDPARSNVQPDELTIDRIVTIAPEQHPVLDKNSLEALGVTITKSLCERLGRTLESGGAMLQPLGRREVCVAINSIALIAALRPHLMQFIIPSLVGFHNENLPGSSDGVVLATLKSNLIKLLSHPAAQPFADEVTECLISLGASERAFRAISKSKVPRRKYVSAPSEASLRKARIGKRSAQSIAEKVENDTYKRNRIGDSSSSNYTTNTSSSSASAMASTPLSSQQITHEGIVNMVSSSVVNLVLESFASELPGPPPPNLKLELTPSELKARMLALLGKIATPSSALAIENSNKRMRDPRRRRDPRVANQEQPSLVQIFDGDAVDEVSDWVSKNASSIAEPLISVSEDNVVQVFLKPATAVWCREMAVAALSRILENEYGLSIRGDEKLRESVLCRLASSPWLLLTDDKNNKIDVALSDSQVPAVYQSILDFVLEDFSVRSTLAMALVYHEYTRFTGDQLTAAAASVDTTDAMETGSEVTSLASTTTDAIYRKTTAYFFSSLVKKMDLSSAADKKLFGALIAQLPRVTIEILQVLGSLFDQKSGVVLGITALRDLIKERAVCQTPALRILLRYTCHEEEGTRNSSIRCVANQLYSLDALKEPIEQFAIRLVQSLGSGGAAQENGDDGSISGAGDVDMEDASEPEAKVFAAKRQWLQNQIRSMRVADKKLKTELLTFATQRQDEILLSKPLENEQETLRRIELYLALCAKKPTLLTHIVATYAHASDAVRQVIFHAVEKLIKHLKQRGTVNVVAQLHGFEPNALGFVCHVIQILSARARPNEESAATEELVQQVIALYYAHEHIPDAISVLIPILPSIRADVLFPLLPQLLSLPQTRLSVAITRLLEAMPPQVVAPIDLLVALHHVDLKSEPTMQKKVISAINFCVEHRHAFPSDVLLHVCRVLVQDERISKLALRTLILSVTAYPTLQQDMTGLLEILVARRVWEMEDALWKGFVKCSALIQPASFPLLLTRLPLAQLRGVLEDEPELRKLLPQFVTSPDAPSDLRISPEVRELLSMGEVGVEDEVKGEVKQETFEEEMEVAPIKTEEVEEEDESKAFVKNEEEDSAPIA